LVYLVLTKKENKRIHFLGVIIASDDGDSL